MKPLPYRPPASCDRGTFSLKSSPHTPHFPLFFWYWTLEEIMACERSYKMPTLGSRYSQVIKQIMNITSYEKYRNSWNNLMKIRVLFDSFTFRCASEKKLLQPFYVFLRHRCYISRHINTYIYIYINICEILLCNVTLNPLLPKRTSELCFKQWYSYRITI